MLNVEVETETVSSIVNVFTFGKGKNKKEILRSRTSKWKKNDGKKQKKRRASRNKNGKFKKKTIKNWLYAYSIVNHEAFFICLILLQLTSFYIMSFYSRFK